MAATLTPIEQRLLILLGDGTPRSAVDLVPALADELGPPSNVRPHLMRLREKLAVEGKAIVCSTQVRYRLVACTSSSSVS